MRERGPARKQGPVDHVYGTSNSAALVVAMHEWMKTLPTDLTGVAAGSRREGSVQLADYHLHLHPQFRARGTCCTKHISYNKKGTVSNKGSCKMLEAISQDQLCRPLVSLFAACQYRYVSTSHYVFFNEAAGRPSGPQASKGSYNVFEEFHTIHTALASDYR